MRIRNPGSFNGGIREKRSRAYIFTHFLKSCYSVKKFSLLALFPQQNKQSLIFSWINLHFLSTCCRHSGFYSVGGHWRGSYPEHFIWQDWDSLFGLGSGAASFRLLTPFPLTPLINSGLLKHLLSCLPLWKKLVVRSAAELCLLPELHQQ